MRDCLEIRVFSTPRYRFRNHIDTGRRPEADHTKGVFDPEIRGKTDRYVLRFRKP